MQTYVQKLNGWVRLWVVFSAIGFIVSSCVVMLYFPSPKDIRHADEMYKQLKSESLKKIADSKGIPVISRAEWSARTAAPVDISNLPVPPLPPRATLERPAPVAAASLSVEALQVSKSTKQISDIQSTKIKPRFNGVLVEYDPFRDIPLEIKGTNGHTLFLMGVDSKTEANSIAEEYNALLNAKANFARLNLIFKIFSVWLFGVLLMYALGWSVGWVYRGFKMTK